MGVDTKIEWCHHTANTWWGCTKVSDGCKNCYAERDSKRRGFKLWGPNSSRRMIKGIWNDIRKWAIAAAAADERRRVFWGSFMDVCENLPELVEPRNRFCALVEELEDLDFLILTKRPENYLKLMPWGKERWPKNAWAGTSAENQELLESRSDDLLNVKADITWLSCEPLLGPLDMRCCLRPRPGCEGEPAREDCYRCWQSAQTVKWVIVGGESGPGARPFNVDWATSIIKQCKDANVACFVKQLGAKPMVGNANGNCGTPNCTHPDCGFVPVKLTDQKGGDMSEWPKPLRVRQFPEVARAR